MTRETRESGERRHERPRRAPGVPREGLAGPEARDRQRTATTRPTALDERLASQSPAEPEPSRRPPLLGALPVLLGVVAGVALCAGGALLLRVVFAGTPTPPAAPPTGATTSAICADLLGQRYSDLYTRLAPALQAQGTEAQFVASQGALDTLQGRVTACQAQTGPVAGASAPVTLTLQRAQAGSLVAHLTLSDADGGDAWRIAAYDATI